MSTHTAAPPLSPLIRRSVLAAALIGATLGSSTAAAQGAATTLATEHAPTRVAAWDGTVMWSRQDPSSGRYTLMKSVAGAAPVAVGVPQRSGTPFDVDLGTSSSGATFAVYTRNGDLYSLDVATGAETKVAGLSSPKAERNPTVQRGRIAFIRRSGGADELRIGSANGASKGSRLLVRRSTIRSAELGNRHVAYVAQKPYGAGGEQQLRIRNLATGADKQVYRARSGGANSANITRPSYIAEPEGFLFARTNMGSGGGNRLIRYTLRGAKLDYDRGSPFYISTAWVDAQLGAVTTDVVGGSESIDSTSPGACTDTGRTYCTVQLSGPLTFGLQP
jgi:hypothetical protein